MPTPSSGGYVVPGFSQGVPAGGGSNIPAAPTTNFSPTPYDLNSDPWVILANNMNASGLSDLDKQYQLKLQGISNQSTPYTGDGGVAAAQLALQQAQENADASKAVLNHNLPLQLLKVVNGLAAHGLGRSGDATFLPGETNFDYTTNVANLDRDLKFKQQNIQMAQQQQAAAQAAYSANASRANKQSLDELNLWLEESKADMKNTLAKAYLSAFQQAQQNPALYSTSTGDLSSILKGLGVG